MNIRYHALPGYEEYPEELCVLRYRGGETSDYRFYVPKRTCVPTKQHVRVSCSQERVTYLCDCGEVLGGYETNTIPWTHRSDERELPNYCPKCGARIEVEE